MRLERLGSNKFKIFLTFDDLVERGFTREELWYNFPKTHQLFQEMLFEASDELGFDIDGNLLVHVHLLQAQGMVVVVTQELDFVDEDYIEMKVTLDENKEFIFSFYTFESVIQVCEHLSQMNMYGGTVYHWEDQYYMQLSEEDLLFVNRENVIAVMSEFSSPSAVTSIRLKEYGKVIMEDNAIQQIQQYFN
ncbi:adapter protein MecA 1/2 [Salirhabdus euzebyi]|uniref:Adapter protein MecA n=1 Tax=Salirhabdus euzebyi TaxID=394506 RepID=A0A841PTP9_9BACI|nr:genetic competence negative regulator [Salirhabdus euzebyi]MBB6452180.1 adapter protein MecA 1/2 [Salirhabdus euzebyi]